MAAAPGAADAGATALILCAHGRGGAAEGHHMPESLAQTLAGTGRFARVESCYLRGRPGLAESLADMEPGPVVLVPLLMADGHTSQVLLPAALAEAGDAGARVTVTPPLGTHPALARLVVRNALATCLESSWEPAETTVVVAAHGTTRHTGSGTAAERLAERVAASGRFRRSVPAFLEQDPSIDAILRDIRPGPCIVVGLFMDHGGHSTEDVPRLVAAAHPDAAYSGALGAHPGLADIVLEMALQAVRP